MNIPSYYSYASNTLKMIAVHTLGIREKNLIELFLKQTFI